MIWQRSQRFLIEADTFISVPKNYSRRRPSGASLVRILPLPEAIRDPPAGQVIRTELHQHTVTEQDADVVHLHSPGDMRQNVVTVREFHLEHGVRQRVLDDALDLDDFFLLLRRSGLSFWHSCPLLAR